jgi:hypothetical protein
VIRGLAYASCYVYSPAGRGAVCERSRLLRALLKAGDAGFMLKYALRVRQQVMESPPLAGFFGTSDILVPVPGSAPYIAGALWTAQHLAVALVNEGLGAATWSGLRRTRAIRKSATAPPGKRPTVGLQYESLIVEHPPIRAESIVLIDDVVTKGRTLLAAANRVHEAFPCAQIRAFALLRTQGLAGDIRQLLEPCKGEIRWKNGDAHRCP